MQNAEMNDSEFELRLPPDFEDGLWDSKGYFEGAELVVEGKEYRLVFYNPVRLMQDAQEEVASVGSFFEPNLIVVESVKRDNMRKAVERIIKRRDVKKLVVSEV